MPIDPASPPSGDSQLRLLERLANLERELRTIKSTLSGGATAQLPVVAALPPAGRLGRLLILSTDGHVYRDTGAAWVDVG
jgi:hypothetical protein